MRNRLIVRVLCIFVKAGEGNTLLFLVPHKHVMLCSRRMPCLHLLGMALLRQGK
jgi:hypothetical protein